MRFHHVLSARAAPRTGIATAPNARAANTLPAPSRLSGHVALAPVSTGPAVLALHGTASEGRQWQPLAVAFASRRVAAPDLPGYGTTPGRLDRLDFLLEYLDLLDGRVDIVAHSFGGAVALKLANLRPDRVRRIAIYDPVAPITNDRSAACIAPDLRQLWQAIEAAPPAGAMARFIDFWVAPGTWAGLSDPRRMALIAQHATVTRDFREILSGLWHVDRRLFTGRLDIIQGARSPQVIADVTVKIARDYPQARCTRLDGLGHMAPLTDADRVTPVFLNCLTDALLPRAAGPGLAEVA